MTRERRNLSALIGILCVIMGIMINKLTLEKTVVSDGRIESTQHNIVIIVIQLALVGFGLYLLIKRPRIHITQVLLMACSILVTILMIELALQGFYRPKPIKSGWKAEVPESQKNQLGFRGQPFRYTDEDYVIVLLGDSHVKADACSFGWMPERRLQHHLNAGGKRVKVFSLAASGYGQDQQLLVLQEYYQKGFRADLVLLWQSLVNDIYDNMFPTHGIPKPTFWLENGELRGPQELMGQELASPSIKLLALWKKVFPQSRDGEWEEKYLPEPYTPMLEYDGPVNVSWQELWDNNHYGIRHQHLDSEKSLLAFALTPRSRRMQYGLDLTRKLYQEIEKLVSSHGGELIIFRYGKEPVEMAEDAVYLLNGKYYRTSRLQALENANYLNDGFKHYTIPVTIEEWRVGPEDGHLNEHATDQVMRDLAQQIGGLIPRRE